MRVLGIESSCDETAAAVVEDGRRVLAERVASQADAFAAWGGVVPEIAARAHVEALPGVLATVLADAGLRPGDLDGVAVGAWPGLTGSLVCGVTAAKAIALGLDLPLMAVDHVQAHLAAIHLGRDAVAYPLVGLAASGGHSHLFRCRGPGDLDLLGGTIDDAAGEAFDKGAAVLGLPYPGGPELDRLAETGDPTAIPLPRSFMGDPDLRLSFAGLKTAFLYAVRGQGGRGPAPTDPQRIADAAASLRAAVVDQLEDRLLLAARREGVRGVAVAGGVACNRLLRRRLAASCQAAGLELYLPEPRHCADNAAMIAVLGHHHLLAGRTAGRDLVPLPTGRAGPRA
jgi:N6-L-threonylcarbamoyladenine synthase